MNKNPVDDTEDIQNHAFAGEKRIIISDISVATVDVEAGESVSFLTDHHGIGMGPARPTITPASWDGDRLRDIAWESSAVGYQSPEVEMRAVMMEPLQATFAFLPDRLFKSAAFETIDSSKIDARWSPNIVDPVLAQLLVALKHVDDTSDAKDFPMIGEAVATALAVRMMQQLGATIRTADVPHAGGLPKETLQRVLDYIEANIGEQLRLTELASVATLSTFHFARAFQKAMNIAPVRYVWRRRIERAKEALRVKKTPLVVVAIEAGFSSQSHFATSFKKATGMTPAVFRAALLGFLVPPWLLEVLIDSIEVLPRLA